MKTPFSRTCREFYHVCIFVILLAITSLNAVIFDEVAVAVIGCGPAALSCACITTESKIPTAIISDSSKILPVTALQTPTEMFPLCQHIKWQEVLQRLSSQINYDYVLKSDSGILSIEGNYPKFIITTKDGKKILSRCLVIATGADPIPLGIANELNLIGSGLNYCIYDSAIYSNMRLCVVGNSELASVEAKRLALSSNQVLLISNKRETLPSNITQIKASIRSISKDTEGKLILSLKTPVGIEEHKVDNLFVLNGFIPNSRIISGTVNCDSNGFIITQVDSQKTSRIGIFACGLVTSQEATLAADAVLQGVRAGKEARELLLDSEFGPLNWKKLENLLLEKNSQQKGPKPNIK